MRFQKAAQPSAPELRSPLDNKLNPENAPRLTGLDDITSSSVTDAAELNDERPLSGPKKTQNPHVALSKQPVTIGDPQLRVANPTAPVRKTLDIGDGKILSCSAAYRVGDQVVGSLSVSIPPAELKRMRIDPGEKSAVHELVTERIFERAARWELVRHSEEDAPVPRIDATLYDSADHPFAHCRFYFVAENYDLEPLMADAKPKPVSESAK